MLMIHLKVWSMMTLVVVVSGVEYPVVPTVSVPWLSIMQVFGNRERSKYVDLVTVLLSF